jgi:hypothetical protein
MLKADAWPYPVYQDLEYELQGARFENTELKTQARSDKLVIIGRQLRNESRGSIVLTLSIKTSMAEIGQTVYGESDISALVSGARLLCLDSKCRRFTPAETGGKIVLSVPLEHLHGVAEITPQVLAGTARAARNGVTVHAGAVVALPREPIVLAIDEDWTGETIPVRWESFKDKGLPEESLLHVQLGGPSHVPELWLNTQFRQQVEGVLLRTGGGSPVALAGAAMREFVWIQVWEKVLPWAIENENDEHLEWPSTRIARYWRTQFERNDWDLPNVSELDSGMLDGISMRIQHCLSTGQKLARIHQIARFQPEAEGQS